MNASLQADFPVYSKRGPLTYLDSAASALTPQVVIDAISDYYINRPVNVHRGVYQLSHEATNDYERARQTVADFINARFEEVIFTRGASSALNLVAQSFGANHINAGDEIIVSELEHHSSVLPWQQLARQKGAKLVYVPLEKGRITLEGVTSVMTARTKVIALTHVSNVMGTITPIKPIIEAAKARSIITVVDAAQSAPHMSLDVKALDADFLAFSGHKVLGPTGVGVLYGKYDLLEMMPPLEWGGDMIDVVEKHTATHKNPPFKFETGTPPIAQAIGLARALDYLQALGLDTIHRHEVTLKDQAIAAMQDIEGVTVYNADTDTGIITFNLDRVHPHDAVSFFDEKNIALRAGHHCAQLLMHYLEVPATLRASFYLYNTEADVSHFINALKEARQFFTEVGF